MKIEEISRPLLGDDLINFIFLGSLFLLIISKIILIPKDSSVFKFSIIPSENENFTLYTAICSFIYIILLTLTLLPFFNVVIPFYNSQITKFLTLLVLLSIYQTLSYVLGSLFFFILGKTQEFNDKYKNRYIFLFIKLFIAILLCTITYYTDFPEKYKFLFIIICMGTLLFSEWIWMMFFVKNKIKLPSYYDFLYLCTFEILPALCVLKLVFLGDKL